MDKIITDIKWHADCTYFEYDNLIHTDPERQSKSLQNLTKIIDFMDSYDKTDMNLNYCLYYFQLFVFRTSQNISLKVPHDIDDIYANTINKPILSILNKYKYYPDLINYIDGVDLDEVEYGEYIILEPYLEYLKINVLKVLIESEEELKKISKKIKGISINAKNIDVKNLIMINKFTELEEINLTKSELTEFIFLHPSLRRLNLKGNNEINKLCVNEQIEHINIIETKIKLQDLRQYKFLKTIEYEENYMLRDPDVLTDIQSNTTIHKKVLSNSSIDTDQYSNIKQEEGLKDKKHFSNLTKLNVLGTFKKAFKLGDYFNNLTSLKIKPSENNKKINIVIDDLNTLEHLNIKTNVDYNKHRPYIHCPNINSLTIDGCLELLNYIKINNLENLKVKLSLFGLSHYSANNLFNPNVVNRFKNLTTLSIVGINKKSYKDSSSNTSTTFKNLDNLKELNIEGEKFYGTDNSRNESFQRYRYQDNIVTFDKSMLGEFPSLTKLSLKNIKFELDILDNYTNLTYLELYNICNYIPNTLISKFKNLKTFKLIHSKFEYRIVKNDFANLSSLEHLEMVYFDRYNGPTSEGVLAKDVFQPLVNLKTLILVTYGIVSEYDNLFSGLYMLESLYFQGKYLNINIEHLVNLRQLYLILKNGNIEYININLPRLDFLEFDCPIYVSDDLFKGLPNLYFLKMDVENIASLDLFKPLKSLKTLSIEDDHLANYFKYFIKSYASENKIYLKPYKKNHLYFSSFNLNAVFY